MNMDLRSTAIAGQVYERRWQDNGTEVIFQWQNCARYSSTSPFVLNERFSFQIRINKSTGVVRIIYGNMTTIVASTTYQPVVGLRGTTNTDFNNRRLTATIPDATPNWGAPNGTTAGTSNAHTVRFTSAASCFPVSGLTFTWTPPPPPTPPSNDYCSGTTNVPCGTSSLAGTTVGTVVETAPFSLSSSYGVWYTFAGDGQQTTITSTTTFDHSLLFMSGSCSGLSYITNIDNSTLTETYTFITTVGVQYYVYVAHYLSGSTTKGTFTMSRTCTTPPVPPINDNPSGAISITLNTGTYSTHTNVNATSTSVTSPSCASYTGEDVWFSVVVPSNGIVELDMIEGVITDGGMSVYTGSIGSLVEIGCDDDNSVNGAMSYLYLTNLPVGQTIYIRVWEYGGGTTGTFGILANSPIGLPVELLYFEGYTHPSYNLLKWATASEHNSDYFSLEKSIDGENWEKIHQEQAAGNSTEKIQYLYLDNINISTINYYRLIQYDIDGVFKIYGPISLNNLTKEKKIIKVINLLGQEIDEHATGFVIEVYEDGTLKKTWRP